jgi:TRAP-type C4-dicarboxylate transport system permease small subunit
VLGVSYAWLYGVALVFGAAMTLVIINNIWQALRTPQGPQLTKDLGDRILEKMPEVAADRHDGTRR